MRRSDCIARIPGSMNPQSRKCPIVAGSARTSFWTSAGLIWGGRGFSVNVSTNLLWLYEWRLVPNDQQTVDGDCGVARPQHRVHFEDEALPRGGGCELGKAGDEC